MTLNCCEFLKSKCQTMRQISSQTPRQIQGLTLNSRQLYIIILVLRGIYAIFLHCLVVCCSTTYTVCKRDKLNITRMNKPRKVKNEYITDIYAWLQLCKLKHVRSEQRVAEKWE